MDAKNAMMAPKRFDADINTKKEVKSPKYASASNLGDLARSSFEMRMAMKLIVKEMIHASLSLVCEISSIITILDE